MSDGYRFLEVQALNPTIGAEVFGVDLAKLDDARFAEIERAFADHQVLVFRDQQLSPEDELAFGRRFGELHVHPAAPSLPNHPEVMIIHADERSKTVAGEGWHTDVSCDERPPMATILRLETVPPSGGDTLFASMYSAYESLSEPMRQLLGGLRALHASDHVYGGRYGKTSAESRDGAFPSAIHPVIRTHPVTGRKALFVNPAFTTRILELTREESANLLSFLYRVQQRPEHQCRVIWKPNTVTLWDNRCTHHCAIWDYFPHVRHGYRVSIVGERPF